MEVALPSVESLRGHTPAGHPVHACTQKHAIESPAGRPSYVTAWSAPLCGYRHVAACVRARAESVQTINQLLTEMDGFSDNTGVIVMAATNRPAALDTALTRPGRFDRVIHLPLPNLEVRLTSLPLASGASSTCPCPTWRCA